MAKLKYRDWSPKPATMQLIMKMNALLDEYNGARVSVRQLYYRLVSADIIANRDEEYRRIQGVITDARYAGYIDWDLIEDRNREPVKPREWPTARAALDEITRAFRMDRWEGQPFYVELWVEKAALAGVLAPIASDYHITLMVNRGYGSASAMKESADRISHHSRANSISPYGHRPVVLYLGDHDPSGEDMVRDIQARLLEFRCPEWLDVRKIALTWDQIQEFKPPPNPVKLTDARAAAYVAKYGEHSWEVDALPPQALNLLVRQSINAYVDKPAMEKAITRENILKNRIKKFSATFQEEP